MKLVHRGERANYFVVRYRDVPDKTSTDIMYTGPGRSSKDSQLIVHSLQMLQQTQLGILGALVPAISYPLSLDSFLNDVGYSRLFPGECTIDLWDRYICVLGDISNSMCFCRIAPFAELED